MKTAEMRRPDSGEIQVEDYKVYYSGKNDELHEHGVGIFVSLKAAQCVTNFTSISERVVLL